jgi:hypothetical protein
MMNRIDATHPPAFYGILRWVSCGLAVLALLAGAALLLLGPRTTSGISAVVISAAPLLLVGVAFLALQPVLRPSRSELLKNMLLALTFLLWGGLQFLPQNSLSAWLGNLVIVLYVVDLAWVVLGTKFVSKGN